MDYYTEDDNRHFRAERAAREIKDEKDREISELKHKITELEIELKAMRGAANSYKAKVEGAKEPIQQHCLIQARGHDKTRLFKLQIRNITAEAITEFAKRLCEGRVSNDPVVIAVQSELRECKLYNVEGDNNE